MKIPCKYERLEDCSKEDLINKIMVRDKHCCDLKELLDKWLKKYKELGQENKKLKSDLAYERTILDNVRAEYGSTQNVIKKMKAELERYKKQYEHTMWEN